MDAGIICYEGDNETAYSTTLGFGGRHRARGAQFIQRGHFTGAADWELDRFGTVIKVEPSNGDVAHWVQFACLISPLQAPLKTPGRSHRTRTLRVLLAQLRVREHERMRQDDEPDL